MAGVVYVIRKWRLQTDINTLKIASFKVHLLSRRGDESGGLENGKRWNEERRLGHDELEQSEREGKRRERSFQFVSYNN